jgi:hypothetical protein
MKLFKTIDKTHYTHVDDIDGNIARMKRDLERAKVLLALDKEDRRGSVKVLMNQVEIRYNNVVKTLAE